MSIVGSKEFSEVRDQWQTHISETLQSERGAILQEVRTKLGDELDKAKATSLADFVSLRNNRFIKEKLIPACSLWLQKSGISPAPTSEISTDVFRSLELRFGSTATTNPMDRPTRPVASAVAASSGALLGALVSRWFSFDSQPKGWIIALVVGAAGAVFVLSWFLRWLRMAAIGTWHPGLPGFHRTSPRRIRDSGATRSLLEDRLGQFLRESADLVLALNWVQVRCQRQASRSAVPQQIPRISPSSDGGEPTSLYEAIGRLDALLTSGNNDGQELKAASEEVVQRFQDEGFEWRTLPEETRYDAATVCLFDSFGHIEKGHSIKTLRPALLRDGVLKKRGLVRREREAK